MRPSVLVKLAFSDPHLDFPFLPCLEETEKAECVDAEDRGASLPKAYGLRPNDHFR